MDYFKEESSLRKPITTIEKIEEYLFNTYDTCEDSPTYNITEEYLKQTLEFLKQLADEEN